MKVSFITTTYNEEQSIIKLLDSLFAQVKLPDEIVIVDGGSKDRTLEIIKKKIKENNKYHGKFKLLIKKGNRSVGRNEAINNSTGDVILCSDAGCILDKKWIQKMTEPFINKEVDVVAGYYKGRPVDVFQQCLIPYVLVPEDRVDKNNFLPASRSMGFRKEIWKKVKYFPEEYSHNEDYVFAKRLIKIKANIVFRQDAIVYWIPRKTFKEAFVMFFRFAFGDAEAGIFRPKVLLIFLRYIFLFILLLYFFISGSMIMLLIIFLLFLFYVSWSIAKNYKYVGDYKAFLILPALQFVSDIAVLTGTCFGVLCGLNVRKG